MRIGVPTEIKTLEFRVGLVPPSVRELTARGHEVLVQAGAGKGIGVSDEEYRAAGARIASDAATVYAQADMIVKVKEPQPGETALLRPGQVLFAYLHLAADRPQADGLMASGCTAIAFETVTDAHGGLPLLAPMSEVAGRMAVQVGAASLQKANGGSGVLLGPVTGTEAAQVTVIGGGVAGTNAAEVAAGMGARVTLLEKNLDRIRQLRARFGHRAEIVYSTADAVERWAAASDLVVGAVLIPGAAAPKLVDAETVATMRPGSVLVDVAIDQGGCFETSRPTTHAEPTYEVDGVIHYCVTNMPGAVPRTSAYALNYAILPHTVALADKGWQRAVAEDAHLRAGLTVHAGHITHRAVAADLGLPCADTTSLEKELAA